jgi:hypothetical protein
MIQFFWFYIIISIYYFVGIMAFIKIAIANKNKKIYFIDATPLLENKTFNTENTNYI